ncbi:MAG: ATP-dependent DNA helicase RecG [Burkholderiales bacterium]|jgi:ATP-dependent DNA helicase RecG|nr:MAG: ATP-dependent DNA helicase RecG [Burkholderiales bacterium]
MRISKVAQGASAVNAASSTAKAGKTPDASAKPARSAPQKAMDKLGLVRDIDLALHLPLRYEDETRLTLLRDARDGDTVQLEGVVTDNRIEARSRRQLLVRMDDGTGEALLRFLNFYGSQQKSWAPGVRLRVRGELRHGFWGREMVHPTVRIVSENTPLATSLTPVYPTSAGLPQAYLRKAVASALSRVQLDELIPPEHVTGRWPGLREALHYLHHPSPEVSLSSLEDHSHPAWQRLKFEELLAQQVSQMQARAKRAHLKAPVLQAVPQGLQERLRAILPFQLTGAQRKVCEEIARDLALPRPMHRLLQGDVGSGKTVVAALAAAIAIDAGWQCALMAPTEILAEQHFRKLVGWLEPLGVKVAWLTGSLKAKAKRAQMEAVASGEAQLVVGTHAVIQDQVEFAKLGLALIDEQHRFGVAQRLQLRRKLESSELEPHLLMMSATPIPRTLAMTYLADLEVSTIDELPPGRTPIVTKVFADTRRPDVIERIRDEVAKGSQVYWVCPLIDETEDSDQAADEQAGRASNKRPPLDLSNVTQTHQELSEALQGFGVGLLHGRLPAAEKAEVMGRFARNELSVLVATTVIEVGVDVPNASLMVIEHAERFGLSQLHQLRGRVGRGAVASVCVLLYASPLSDSGKQRLKAMAETTDGFEIARRDLEIRGPGEFMGSRQSGAALLRFADLNEDQGLVARARQVAQAMLRDHPEAAQRHVERWLGAKSEFLKA